MALERPIVSAIFFQADTIRGYRFWDEAGVLANEFSKRFQSINYGAPGILYCSNPKDPNDLLLELRVNVYNIWVSFRGGGVLDSIHAECVRLVDWIARAIHVTQFSRQGLRVQMLWGGKDLEHVISDLRSHILCTQQQGWDELGDVGGGEYVVHIGAGHLTARVSIAPVQNVRTQIQTTVPGAERSPSTPALLLPDYALMSDVDVVNSHITESTDVGPHLRQSTAFIDDRLAPFVAKRLVEDVS